ncbi:response regulator transcription factor [Aurantiacibacter sp. MUD61]|uniref:response regulator transcription factor n=1 Tax=Aurantiacibacter sp. MUD61 TaxID=3009083 RepID=UPI0022F02ADC|nr:helix-turn-helix transcriptional regulator [Aurantiacibacter sp. MUD61]
MTDKQREVLDLLVQHKTSKEIARLLKISPHTVDQRISAARRKFGAQNRNELAAAYMSFVSETGQALIYGKSVYQSSHVETSNRSSEEGDGIAASHRRKAGEPGSISREKGRLPVVVHRVVPEPFEGRFGIVWRIAAIAAITLIFLIAILVGFAIFGQLSEMLR